jgi:hypothetical protein
MEADSESAASVKAKSIVSPDDTTSSSSNVRTSAVRSGENNEHRRTKRRRVTLDGLSVDESVALPVAPPSVAQPPSSLKKIIVDDLRSDDEGTLIKSLEDLWWVHLDTGRDDLDFKTAIEEFLFLGGHLAVSWIMDKHPNCKGIQRNGISVVMEASYYDSTNGANVETIFSTNVAKQLGNTRAIHVVYAAMQRFPQDTKIIRCGFGALCNLTFQCESNCKILVEELDALAFLVERMASTVNDVTGIKWACAMLRNISKFPQFRPRVIRAKAVSALAHAMENHETDEDIQDYSKKALTYLFSEN